MSTTQVPGDHSPGAYLYESVNGLADREPMMSARKTIYRGQLVALIVFVVALAALWPRQIGASLVGFATLLYVANLSDRIWLFASGIERSPELRIEGRTVRAIPDDELPIYTVLVPAFNEPEIVSRLIVSLGSLDYPPERLDIKLLLEADDLATVEVAQQALSDRYTPVEIVLVPPADPRTKPKACNYGLQTARGAFTTIYDAEDLPEPLQLRRAAYAFRFLPETVACIQAKLYYHNDRQNLLTRWFTSEYNQWFGYTLPGLMRTKAAIPLGGTSNHIRTEVLKAVGGWDPFNVTEDADLGIRLARLGYRTAILDSITLEEANSDAINWIRQRSRWYKGYLQTFLVHTRQPRRLLRELGWRGTLRFISVTAGTPFISLVNVVFWALAIAWELGEPAAVRELFPTWIYYPAMTSLFLGNAAVVYCAIVAARVERSPRLLFACFLVPAYWLLMSIAAVKAFVQLVFQPFYWEKTFHGLGDNSPVAAAPDPNA
jgi:glycosyltransferase XagB